MILSATVDDVDQTTGTLGLCVFDLENLMKWQCPAGSWDIDGTLLEVTIVDITKPMTAIAQYQTTSGVSLLDGTVLLKKVQCLDLLLNKLGAFDALSDLFFVSQISLRHESFMETVSIVFIT